MSPDDYKSVGMRASTKAELEEWKHRLRADSFDATIREILERAGPLIQHQLED